MSGDHAEQDAKGHSEDKGGEYISPKVRRIIGEGTLLLVFLLADAYDVWPRSHLAALIGAVIGCWGLLFAETPVRWSFAITIILIGFAEVISSIAGDPLPEETASHGWLEPATDPTPSSCEKDMWDGSTMVVFGNTQIITPHTDQKRILFEVGSCPALWIRENENRLFIDADIFDTDRTLIARIRDNEFNIVPGEISYSQRLDRSTLVVFDKKGGVLLAVRYNNPRVVTITGVFSCPGSGPVTATPAATLGLNNGKLFGHLTINATMVVGGCVILGPPP